MKNDGDIVDLFRSRLDNSQMEVRDNFWESLQTDLSHLEISKSSVKKRCLFGLYRVSVAASVLLFLGLSFVAVWHFSPKEEIKQAFIQIKDLEPQAILPIEISQSSTESLAGNESLMKAILVNDSSEVLRGSDEQITVSFSFTMRKRTYGSCNKNSSSFLTAENVDANNQSSSDKYDEQQDICSTTPLMKADVVAGNNNRGWALKTVIGSAMPKGDFLAPVVVGLSVERIFNKRISLEAGLQYHRLPAKGVQDTWNALAIPVKMNVVLVQSPKWMWYASAGGAVEKVLERSFQDDPLRLSVSVGMGVTYKVHDRFSVFAEPVMSHHFHTDTHIKNLRTERTTNMNLLCGVRITY